MLGPLSLIVTGLCASVAYGATITSIERELAIVAGRSEQPSLPVRREYLERPERWTPDFICSALRNVTHFIYELDEKVCQLKHRECEEWRDDRHHDLTRWHTIREGLFELEIAMDAFDLFIDTAPVFKCFECCEEEEIVKCHERYTCALIKLLEDINIARECAHWRADKIISIAVQSLRFSDAAFTYELARRMQCREWLVYLMSKQGAADGSTPGSVQCAFSQFPQIPHITGDNYEQYAKEGDVEFDGCEPKRGEECGRCCDSWGFRGQCPYDENSREPDCRPVYHYHGENHGDYHGENHGEHHGYHGHREDSH